MPGAKLWFTCHQTTSKTRRPAILVIEPGEHFLFACLLHTRFDQIHKRLTKIFGCQTGARVNMKASHAHGFEYCNLAQ